MLIKNYFENTQIRYLNGALTHVQEKWMEKDFVNDFNKLYFILSGECSFTILGKEYIGKPGYMYLFPAGKPQSYHNISENRVTKYWIHFDATIGGRNLFDIIQCPSEIAVPNGAYVKRLYKKILKTQADNSSITSVLELQATLYELISYYFHQCGDAIGYNDKLDDNIILIGNYIDKNISRNITVEELAGLVHMHPNYFIRYFRSHFGYSPMKFINKLRIDMAKQLLSSTQKSIGKIASEVGVKDIFYFSNLFKKFTGYSPSEFRNYKT